MTLRTSQIVFSLASVSALSLGLLLAVPGCNLATGGSKLSDPGLILSFAAFGEGARPLSGELAILRPGSGPLVPVASGGSKKKVKPAQWTVDYIKEKELPEEVALGSGPGGRVVYGKLENGVPTGGPMHYEMVGDHWELRPIEGLTENDVTWDRKGEGYSTKPFELAGGNVFHKAFWFEPAFGEPGILTISANMPMIKIWREGADGWSSELLFAAEVGNKEHRFRDIEVGDVDGDGQDELVMATHDRGKVFVLEQKADGLEAIEIANRDHATFVHEIELGDVDGDGMDEIFTTPSEPNSMDGSHQAGQIERIDFEGGEWVIRNVENSETTHAKEILLADIEQDGQLELYSAMEGEGLAGLGGQGPSGASTQIKRYDFTGAESEGRVVTALPSDMCRFLNLGDIEGDGQLEILASTRSAGIFRIFQSGGEWGQQSEVSALQSGGFEHSSVLLDIDGDGSDELFVADDDNKRVLMWYWDEGRERLRKVELLDRSDQDIYITWGVMPLR